VEVIFEEGMFRFPEWEISDSTCDGSPIKHDLCPFDPNKVWFRVEVPKGAKKVNRGRETGEGEGERDKGAEQSFCFSALPCAPYLCVSLSLPYLSVSLCLSPVSPWCLPCTIPLTLAFSLSLSCLLP